MSYYVKCGVVGGNHQELFWINIDEIENYNREFMKFIKSLGLRSLVGIMSESKNPSIRAIDMEIPESCPMPTNIKRNDELLSKGYMNISVIQQMGGDNNKANKKIITKQEYIHILIDNIIVPYINNTLIRLEELNNCKFILIDNTSEETDINEILYQVYSRYFMGTSLVSGIKSLGSLQNIMVSWSQPNEFEETDEDYDTPKYGYERVCAEVGFTSKSSNLLRSDTRFVGIFKKLIQLYGNQKENEISPLNEKTVYIRF